MYISTQDKVSSPNIFHTDATLLSSQQHSLAASFGMFASWQGDPGMILHEACRVAAEGTQAVVAGLLCKSHDDQTFVLQAGIGWPTRMIGRARFAADSATTAGLALCIGRSLHFGQSELDQMIAHGRIRVPEALAGYGLRQIISVPIEDGEGPIGVLEVGSAIPDGFAQTDVHFLESLAAEVSAILQ